MSLVSPEMPSRPERLFSVEKISSTLVPSLWIRNSMTAGSMSPLRVPIISPSSGVMPIDVSIGLAALDRARRAAVAQVERDDVGFLALLAR